MTSEWNWPTIKISRSKDVAMQPKVAIGSTPLLPSDLDTTVQNHMDTTNHPAEGYVAVQKGKKKAEKEEEEEVMEEHGRKSPQMKTERLSNGISRHEPEVVGEGSEVMETSQLGKKVANGNGKRVTQISTSLVTGRKEEEAGEEEEEQEEERTEGEAAREEEGRSRVSGGSSEDEIRQSTGSITSGEFLPSNFEMIRDGDRGEECGGGTEKAELEVMTANSVLYSQCHILFIAIIYVQL